MKDVKVLVAATEVTLDADRHGSITPSVVVTGEAKERVVLTAVSLLEGAPPIESWMTVERPLREISAGVVEQYVVTFDATAQAAGRHPVKLIAYPSEEAPEEYADCGQTVTVVVPEKVVPPPPPPRKIPWLLIGIAVVVVVLIAGGIFLFRPAKVEVPNLATLTEAAATKKLTSLGFEAQAQDTSTGGVEVVSQQDPPAGELVPKGSTVKIFVNRRVAVPAVTGLTQAAAAAKLQGAGLTVTVENDPGPPPFGNVTAQSVAAGTKVAKGTAITVKVRVGVTVPPLVGVAVDQAVSTLASVGLQPVTERAINFQFPNGFVFAQSPVGGTVVPPRTTVVLLVSTGGLPF